VDQDQERRVPKRESDTSLVLDDVLQINISLANEKKIQKEYYKEEDDEDSITKHISDDDELSKVDHPGELNDEYLV
jgi:hypothetical protein